MKSRHDLLQSILTISLNAFWSKHDTWALKLLILNTIQTLSDKQLNEAILLTFINDSSLSSNIDGDEFSKNKIQLMSILSEWAEWKVQADNARLRSALIVPFKKLKAGEIIFNSKMGFFLVEKVNHGSKSFLLDRGKTELFRVGNQPLYFTHYSPNILIYR